MQAKMVQLTSAVILCLCLFGQSVMAKPGYASGYDVDYYVSVSSACSAEIIGFRSFCRHQNSILFEDRSIQSFSISIRNKVLFRHTHITHKKSLFIFA